jgi:pimeloyl-ACP methyl ester carboxylesterase
VADYAVGDVAGMLDTLGIETAHMVGHDWDAAVAWVTATFIPDRVNKLVVLSVGHPRAPRMLRQDEMAWY